VTSALAPTALSLELGPSVLSAGFLIGDHQAVVAELAQLAAPGMPERAVAKRKAEFLAGRLAARRALSSLGIDATPGRNDDGSPSWPRSVVGSITHGAGRALCAVSASSELRSLGIDAEKLMAATVSQELKQRICSTEERQLLTTAVPAPEHHLVTFAFSAKESLYKCLYPLMGQFMDFSAARVVSASATTTEAEGDLRGALTLELAVDWSAEFQQGRRFQADFFSSREHVETAVLLAL
jgi:enterobactin synthetase component D